MLVFALVGADPKAIAAIILFALAWATGAETDGDRTWGVLLADLGVSVGVWWLYGPITGAAFVAFGVVALGPFLLTRLASRLILVAALVTVPLRIVLHFAAGEVELPLFHPDDPVPTSEFLTGETIQAVFLLGIGMLMIRIAEMLRRGQAALSLVLDRQREINALKDRFVATVSHELRTPLTSLKGFTRTLLEDDHSPEERQEFLVIMTDQTEELHALIEDLITFSRIEAGGITIKPLNIKLRGLVQDVVSGLGQRAASVSNQVPHGLDVPVDPPRLRQVMRNLIDNALKYGKPPIVVSAKSDGPVVRCSVLDGGDGIDPEKVHLVFEPYARLVDDANMSQPGVGLGLPIVRQLVEAHGGTIRVVMEGEMAGFEFALPSSTAPHQPKPVLNSAQV